ncbi:hypothetical protein PINS_up010776 [Pythium insidiosum]|nr:hypothetical protein PINS_up010776 [Pythium insidiosum]
MKANNVVSVSAIALLSAVTSAEPQYLALIPNGYNVKNGVAIGHKWGGRGGPTTDFGTAFALTHRWTVELCKADSDGDGQTNGQELGDPCCEWKNDGDPVRYSTGLSNPGDASSTANPALWATISCYNGSGSGSASNGSDVGYLRRNATSAPSPSPTPTLQTSAATSNVPIASLTAAQLLRALALTLSAFLTP